MTGAIAAAAAVPTLVLLYFLKLKRQEVLISSTLLWKRAVQDLQVNAPFQRLRRNLLLLLQLLVLAAVLLALARPVLSLGAGPGRRYVLLIDRSASMSATDVGGGSRLEEARRQAGVLIDSLRGPSLLRMDQSGDEAMVLAFDRHARVMCSFTSDKQRLRAALDAVTPTDGPSHLTEAITVARAFAQSAGVDENNRSSAEAARLELFSDGRIADLGQISIQTGELGFHCIGTSSDNVAVVAMQARRSYEKADEVHVFAGLANYGPAEAICDVQLSVEGNVRAVRQVRVPPLRPETETEPSRPGQVSVSFVLVHSGAGVVSVRQLRKDALASDDAAWTVLPPPKKLRALLVTGGNPALESALEACPLAKLDRVTPAQFDQLAADDAGVEYDVVVLDRHAPAKLPRGRYLVFGAPPPDIDVKVLGAMKGQFIIEWRGRHPVLQFVSLEDIYAANAVRMELPRDAAVLAEFGASPAIGLLRRRGSAFLVVGFDVMETNWPFRAGFVMFCYNATAFLGLETGQERQGDLKVGDAITLRSSGPKEARVTRPDGQIEPVSADPSGTFRYPRTDRAGVYRLEVPGLAVEAYAVNVLDEIESHLAPSKEIYLATDVVKAQPAAPQRTNRELWPYLALAALALVCLEWLVYNSKVRL